MKTTEQYEMQFGARSGVVVARPWAEGDILVTHKGVRVVVRSVHSDANNAPLVVCTRLDTGAECVHLEREIAYRSCDGAVQR